MSQFGKSNLADPRTCDITLAQIKDLCGKVDPWNIIAFQKAAKAIKLLSVHRCFWRNWRFVEPSLFLILKVKCQTAPYTLVIEGTVW